MAKDILLRHSRFYLDGYDLTGDSRTIDTLGNAFGEVEISGWSQHKNYISDAVKTAGITGYQAVLNDLTEGAYAVLKDGGLHNASLLMGTGGAPTVGDPAYFLRGTQIKAQNSFESSLAVVQADFVPVNDNNPMGVVLYPLTAIAATTSGASVNNGTETDNGWHAVLHITNVGASPVWAFKIEHSTDGSTWSELGSFSLTGNEISSEHITGTGTVNAYVRFTATKTSGGNVTAAVAIARN